MLPVSLSHNLKQSLSQVILFALALLTGCPDSDYKLDLEVDVFTSSGSFLLFPLS